MSLIIKHKEIIGTYKIMFSYVTKRHNTRQNEAEINATTQEKAVFGFLDWIDHYNKKYPCKPYDNVQILSCDRIKFIRIEL